MTLPASRLCLSETPSVIPQALLLSPRSPALPKSSSTLSTQFILVQSKFKKPFPLPPHSSFLEQEGLQQPSLSAFFRGERHRPFFYLPDLPTHHPPPPAFPSTPPPYMPAAAPPSIPTVASSLLSIAYPLTHPPQPPPPVDSPAGLRRARSNIQNPCPFAPGAHPGRQKRTATPPAPWA